MAAWGGHLGSAEDSKAPLQIFKDGRAATIAAKNVHYAGKLTSGGTAVSLDISVTPARSGGSITENGATIQIIGAGSEVYLRASGPSWTKLTGSSADGQLLANRWIKASSKNADFKGLSQLTNLGSLFGSLQPSGKLTKGGTTKINGQSAVIVKSTKGGILYIADSGTPYILRLVQTKGSDGSGQITFDHYGSANPPAVPSNAIDFNQLVKN